MKKMLSSMRESVEIDHPAGCGLSKGGTDKKKKKKFYWEKKKKKKKSQIIKLTIPVLFPGQSSVIIYKSQRCNYSIKLLMAA